MCQLGTGEQKKCPSLHPVGGIDCRLRQTIMEGCIGDWVGEYGHADNMELSQLCTSQFSNE